MGSRESKPAAASQQQANRQGSMAESAAAEQATLGGGCFWCIEAVFQRIKGVSSVASGYAGGRIPDPSYEDICSGASGHAEVLQLTFDPTTVSYEEILEIFFKAHDPTTLNRQGNDVGPQYRSIILYHDDKQRETAEAMKEKKSKELGKDVVTEIAPLKKFYKAEKYHQNYYNSNSSQSYCRYVIHPKLKKLGLE